MKKQFTKRHGLPDTLFWHLYFLVNTTYTVLICHAWIKNVTRICFQARAKIRNMITLKKKSIGQLIRINSQAPGIFHTEVPNTGRVLKNFSGVALQLELLRHFHLVHRLHDLKTLRSQTPSYKTTAFKSYPIHKTQQLIEGLLSPIIPFTKPPWLKRL